VLRRSSKSNFFGGRFRDKEPPKADAAETETFEVIAREWFEKFKSNWVEGHANHHPTIGK
jgi:hypothetical protein